MNTWHTEQNDSDYSGQRFQLLQDQILCDIQSPYQRIKVFKHKKFGTVLTLDDCVQATTYDEFLYQEMLTYLPLCSVASPEDVLVVGGGDGGIVRELLKDARVKKITLVDIDEMVLDTCKKFIPSMGRYLDHDKVTIVIEDANTYVETCSKMFDVVIVDITDIDVTEKIFGHKFYTRFKEIVNDGGVVAFQTYSPYQANANLKCEIENLLCCCKMIGYGFAPVPSFPNGNIGILFGRITKDNEGEYKPLNKPVYRITSEMAGEMGLKCYYDEYHESCCVMPLGFRDWFRGVVIQDIKM